MGAAYQAADVVSRVFALVTLPLYLHHLTPSDYGVAETIVTAAVLLSIPLRLGLSDALVRFWYLDDDRARPLRPALAPASCGSAATSRPRSGWSRRSCSSSVCSSPGRSAGRCSASRTRRS